MKKSRLLCRGPEEEVGFKQSFVSLCLCVEALCLVSKKFAYSLSSAG